MPFNEQPCFNCGRLPSEGHAARCVADYQEPAEDDGPSSVPPGTGDNWSAPLRNPVRPKCELCGEPMPAGEEMFKYHGFSGPCPKPPLPRQPAKTHQDRANALRDEMCRLASWSRTPNEVAEALIAAVKADNALLDEIAAAEAK